MNFRIWMLGFLLAIRTQFGLESDTIIFALATHAPDWAERLAKPYSSPCETEADCHYLGKCDMNTRKCICVSGFKGSHCHELDLLPTEEHWGFKDADRPSWGGNVIKGEDGRYHLFASFLVNGCDIAAYGTNSAILRASSMSPEGPYKFDETILAPFHHGAFITKDPRSKQYVLWSDGIDIPDKYIHNCRGGTDDKGMPHRIKIDGSQKNGLFRFGAAPHDFLTVSTSDRLVGGTWKQKRVLQSDLKADIACNRTNPSPIIHQDGTVTLVVRTTYCSTAGRPMCPVRENCQHIYLIRYNSSTDAVPTNVNTWKRIKQLEASEDPFFWQDNKGRYHMLLHSKRACGLFTSDTCGVLASSSDGLSWTSASRPAYTGVVQWRTKKTKTKAALMQRPKIMFADDNVTPLFLITGFRQTPNARVRTQFIPFNVKQNAHLSRKVPAIGSSPSVTEDADTNINANPADTIAESEDVEPSINAKPDGDKPTRTDDMVDDTQEFGEETNALNAEDNVKSGNAAGEESKTIEDASGNNDEQESLNQPPSLIIIFLILAIVVVAWRIQSRHRKHAHQYMPVHQHHRN